MISFFLASSNAHKSSEFSTLFDSAIVEVNPTLENIEVEETGATFLENSFLKAQAYYKLLKKPIIADDSGLCVNALPNELGIRSARFGAHDLNDEGRSRLLLEKMKDVNEDKRDAYFVCQLCFYLNPNEIFYFEGRLNGIISNDYRGNDGFGYDPIFIPNHLENGKTLAEDIVWKSMNSHRYKACSEAQKFFKERNCQEP